ncbi:MAG: hypothetical protein ABIQ38_05515 [Ilumatobacteraceae bacterium]
MEVRRALPDDLDQVGENKRRIPEMALGLFLVVGGAFGALMIYRSGTESVTVVSSAHKLHRGQIISTSDLVATEMPGSAAQFFVSGVEAKSLVGKTVAVDVGGHVPLSALMVTSNRPLAASEALTSTPVNVGNYPSEIAPGDRVRVVLAPEITMSVATPPRMFEEIVTVWSIQLPEDFSDQAVITLRGPLELAMAVASAGRVHIVLVGDLAAPSRP